MRKCHCDLFLEFWFLSTKISKNELEKYKLGKHVDFKYSIFILIIGWLIFSAGFLYKIAIGYCVFRWVQQRFILLSQFRTELSPVKDSRETQVNNICAWVPNISGEKMTWYCIILPFAILLLWIVYQTIFMLLISKVMKKNRNTEPTVSSLSVQNQFRTCSWNTVLTL